jgi:DNA-binding transcriptional LysR family regulator
MSLNSDALRLFLGVVDAGSLSAAAEVLGHTASGVSRGLSRLEEDLGVTLLNRTTRRMELTEEGKHFLPKARQIVASLEEAEECMRLVHQRPAGRLRVDASVPVMLHCVVPHVGDFRAQYPEITVELTSNDRIVDLMEHRTDVALRMGPLTDSTLHARPLRPSPRWMMASPDYIARRGAPETVEDLAGHEVLGFTHPESLNVWPLRHAGGSSYVATPTLATSSGETQRQLALRGVGIACLSDFVVREDIAAGRLVKVMEGVYSDYLQPMHAVYHRNTQLSRRIACFLDFYAGRI